MNRKFFALLFLLTLHLNCHAHTSDEVAAGPGHGGGGGGHAGGGVGGHVGGGGVRSMNRSPSMSRPGSYRPGGVQRGAARQPLNQQNAARIRQQIHNQNPQSRNWFNQNFFRQHNYNPYYYNSSSDWWSGSDWGAVNSYIGSDWAAPIYYNQRNPAPIGLEDYSNLPPPPPPAQPEPEPNENMNIPGIPSSWIPLGVFALGNDSNDIAFSTMFVQLALGKNGYVAGTYYNSVTNQVYPIEGSLNKSNQQVVWKLSNKSNSPVLRTGLYNLTQDQTDVTIRFPNGADQTWYMLRVTHE